MGLAKILLGGVVAVFLMGKGFVFFSDVSIETSLEDSKSILLEGLAAQRGFTFRAIETGAQTCVKQWAGENAAPVIGKVLAEGAKVVLTDPTASASGQIEKEKVVEVLMRTLRQNEQAIKAMTPAQTEKMMALLADMKKAGSKSHAACIFREAAKTLTDAGVVSG